MRVRFLVSQPGEKLTLSREKRLKSSHRLESFILPLQPMPGDADWFRNRENLTLVRFCEGGTQSLLPQGSVEPFTLSHFDDCHLVTALCLLVYSEFC